MKKIFLLPALITLAIAGCSIDPTKPIDFPIVDTMYAAYDGPQLWVSKVGFVSALPVSKGVENDDIAMESGQVRVEKSIRRAPSIILTDNSSQILREYLEKTGRFTLEASLSDAQLKSKNLIKGNLALPLSIDAALVELDSKTQGNTHVAQVFGEQASVTKTAVINLIVKDQLGNVLYIAEGQSVVNSADRGVPQVELDDYTVNEALKNAINKLSRAFDQGHIASYKY